MIFAVPTKLNAGVIRRAVGGLYTFVDRNERLAINESGNEKCQSGGIQLGRPLIGS